MTTVCVKLKQRERDKYRKVLTTQSALYESVDVEITTTTPYEPGTALEDGEWFEIPNASSQEYKIDLMKENYTSTDFSSLRQAEVQKTDFLYATIGDCIYFQNISKSKLIAKKAIRFCGDEFEFIPESVEFVINRFPDAIYNKTTDKLYFRKLEAITSIFRGIDQLYVEATDEETTEFLTSDFVQLGDGFDASKVKTANRKRIALARKTLKGLSEDDRNNIFDYIGEYCPDLKTAAASFEVKNEEELKLLLYGIEQRFYTTVVGREKRIANSVVKFATEE